MTLTEERAKVLTEFLNAEEGLAKRLLLLEPNEALEEINAFGNDFSLEELNEYGDALKGAFAKGELDDELLDQVSGGALPAVIIFGVGVVSGATAIGGGIGWMERNNVW
jgi:hypothetical protein